VVFLAIGVLDEIHAEMELFFVDEIEYFFIKIVCLDDEKVFLMDLVAIIFQQRVIFYEDGESITVSLKDLRSNVDPMI
jgi:hypothetical protein